MRLFCNRFAVVATLIVTLVAGVVSGSPAASGGSYTTAQAAAGAKAFAQSCAKCHGAKLQGITAPSLKGPNSPITGIRTVGFVYTYASTQMPLDKPRSLSPTTYAAIVAFLMQQNGHPAGTHALTPSVAAHSTERM